MAMRIGEMASEYKESRSAIFDNTNPEDFATLFAAVYAKS